MGGYSAACQVDVPKAKVDTSLAVILHRTRSQQAGRMAWAIPLAIVPIVGIGWLGYTTYYRNQSEKDIINYRLPEITALIENKALRGHPFVEGDAKLRLQFIGECYEAAANVKDSVLKATQDAQMHNTSIAIAEAQSLYMKPQVLEADATKGLGWFDKDQEAVTDLGNTVARISGLGGKAEESDFHDAGNHAGPILGQTGNTCPPEIKYDL